MNHPEGRFLRSGKVKDIYDVGEGKLLLVYTDRISSHDVEQVFRRFMCRCYPILVVNIKTFKYVAYRNRKIKVFFGAH